MASKIFKAKESGAIFVQKDGPNTAPVYVGCHDLENFDEPEGGISLYRCFVDGKYKTLGFSEEPPDPVSVKLGTYSGATRELLEQMQAGAIYVQLRERGKPNLFTNWKRCLILNVAKRSQKSRSNWAKREEDGAAMTSLTVEALPPVFDLSNFAIQRQTTAETQALNSIAFLADAQAWYAKGGAKNGGTTGFAGADSAAGPATANLDKTVNGGGSWAATTDPFGADEHIGPVITFPVTPDTWRVLVGRALTDAGNPAEIAYSDNNGASWTTVNLGSTNAVFFKAGPNGLWYNSFYDLWAVVSGGHIYQSTDGGLTWTEKGAGTTTSNLNAVTFVNSKVGFAGGAADTLLKTLDGGITWSAMTATGNGGDILALVALDEYRLWATTDDGEIFYSLDGGTTWTERLFTGSGSGTVTDMKFLNDYFGVMLKNTAGPVGTVFITKDGGYTWEALTTPTNAGLNALALIDEETFFVVGEPQNSTAVILKCFAN